MTNAIPTSPTNPPSSSSLFDVDCTGLSPSHRGLRWFSKLLCAAVFGLIFAGAMVTSHDAGLSVPDWPTTYGQNMFLYPPSKWQGGIFFEHVHRLIASGIGFLTVILTLWSWKVEPRKWMRTLSYCALGVVILQGLLGGLTVLLKLPDAVSVAHGVLGQTFFLTTLTIAFGHSKAFEKMVGEQSQLVERNMVPSRSVALWSLVSLAAIYLQLFVGAWMRHSGSGLAIPDFPTMGGSLLPNFSDEFLNKISWIRSELGIYPQAVTLGQVALNLAHRCGALVVFFCLMMFVRSIGKCTSNLRRLRPFVGAQIAILFAQLSLGVATILSVRQPLITSVHVWIGALLLAVTGMVTLTIWTLRLLAWPAEPEFKSLS